MKSKNTAALDVVKLVCRVLDEKKAGAVNVLDVSAQSSITDYLVLATATSEPHLRALRIEVEKALDAKGVHLVGTEAAQESGWVVIDAFDVMMHLFLPQMRDRYGLERLWQDATGLSVREILQAPAQKKPAKRKSSAARSKRAPKPARKARGTTH